MDKDILKVSDTKYGVTKYGFRRKLYSEALEERITRAKRVFGVNVDTSETSFLGKFIRNASWDEAELWERIEEVYFSAFVNFSEGTDLDNVGQYLTITRRPAVRSKGFIKIKGTPKTLVPNGFKLATKSGIVFETTDFAEIGESGYVDVPIRSVEAGKNTNVLANEITEIINPTYGIDEIVNVDSTEGGLDLESDKEFRDRYKKSYSRGGGSTVPALTAALLDIDDVVDVEVKENVSMETIDGIPPKSIACYIYGGSDEEIAQTIYENKSAGIEAFGSTYKYIQDDKGNKHKIGFTRAELVSVYVNIKLKKGVDYKGDDAIKRAIMNYIGGTDDDNITYSGLKLGEDVVLSKVIGTIMCLGGVDDVSVELSGSAIGHKASSLEIDEHSKAITIPQIIRISYA